MISVRAERNIVQQKRGCGFGLVEGETEVAGPEGRPGLERWIYLIRYNVVHDEIVIPM
jgi:hypothetical protein